jgi:ribonucleoside-diphosphate reductase alpha chain
MKHELTEYQKNIHQTKYSRWREDLGRRETWEETVDRYIDFFRGRVPLPDSTWKDLRAAILHHDIVPSMRALMTAGPALEKDEVAGYNCSYLTINRPEAFAEMVYLLMCGVGVGYSVEEQFVEQLPEVPVLEMGDTTIVVADSKYGWSDAVRAVIKSLYAGKVPGWDLSKIRPAGAPLKTFGGRASGPAPLEDLLQHICYIFSAAQGRRLTDLEAHSIATKIGDIVVVGGVRRSAEISLFSAHSGRMASAKSGEWWRDNPHFGMANNSAVWKGQRPSPEQFLDVMTTLIKSKAGEPGIFNRDAAKRQAARTGRRDPNHEFGCNPCGEIILRDRQLCNLTEVIARPTDSVEDLQQKVHLATILGTVQSTLTKFRHLSPQWQRNCEEERLLGVSITGIYDCPLLYTPGIALDSLLMLLKGTAITTNKKYAAKLNIPQSAAVTCVKPSGNTSQLVDSASGIHPRHAQFIIRRNRGNKTDPVARFLADSGVPHEDEIHHPDTTWVFSWPQRAPKDAVTRDKVSAVEHLELWKTYHEYWCEHKPSVTITVRDEEWPDVIAWVWRHWDDMSGVAFLPFDDHSYQQAPYEAVTEEQLVALEARIPALDWSLLTAYETDDRTEGHRELACTAGACEL